MTDTETTTSILGLTVDDWARRLGGASRAKSMVRWLYSDEAALLAGPNVPDVSKEGHRTLPLPDRIEGVSHRVLDPLLQGLTLSVPTCKSRNASEDGTIKYAFSVGRGEAIESVLIPAAGRSTLCVSSQMGCTRHCAFCATARLGFRRNLTAAEIVAQYWLARKDAPEGAPLRNIVFMGMGEPMDNLDQVMKAIRILTQQPEPQLSARNITVSTSGVLPGIRRILAEGRVNLALSLNATTQETRRRLMPQSDAWSMEQLLQALREDAQAHPERDVFVEMVLFDGVNDSEEDARRLVSILQGVNARVNLIAHNAFEGSPFKPTTQAKLQRFKDIVLQAGIRCLTRVPRGQEISAACGQLSLKHSAP